MKTCINLAVAIIASSGSLCAQKVLSNESAEVWYRVPVPENAKVLLVAEEEAEFARKSLGDWFPICLKEVQGKWIEIRLNKIERKNERAEFIYSFRNEKGDTIQYKGGYTDVAEDKNLPSVAYMENGKFYVSMECVSKEFGEKSYHLSARRIMFSFAASREEHEKATKVSKGMPLFRWNELKAEKF